MLKVRKNVAHAHWWDILRNTWPGQEVCFRLQTKVIALPVTSEYAETYDFTTNWLPYQLVWLCENEAKAKIQLMGLKAEMFSYNMASLVWKLTVRRRHNQFLKMRHSKIKKHIVIFSCACAGILFWYMLLGGANGSQQALPCLKSLSGYWDIALEAQNEFWLILRKLSRKSKIPDTWPRPTVGFETF